MSIKTNLVKMRLANELRSLTCYKKVDIDFLIDRAKTLMSINKVWLNTVIDKQPIYNTVNQLYISEKNLKNC